MTYVTPTTPFGRRPLSLGMLATQSRVRDCPSDAATHKWRLFRAITEGKEVIGVPDRALAVLSALLSFHPETALTAGSDLVVFPSNHELGLRSHGMAPATLRRHLAALVDAGLVIRRDSPNGKRYARKDHTGEITAAFGFDLSPLLARAVEFENLAASVRNERQACQRLREQITLLRRDCEKTIEAANEANLPGPWSAFARRLEPLLKVLPRATGRDLLDAFAGDLGDLRAEVDMCLRGHEEPCKTSANESQTERHHQNSNTDQVLESEPGFRKSQAATSLSSEEAKCLPTTAAPNQAPGRRAYPLPMVLQACPDLTDYARHPITSWNEFVATAGLARGALGISPNAWTQACTILGDTDAAIVVAAILQRVDAIRSPGGYLRRLTEKAEAGEFSLGPLLMALLRARLPLRNSSRSNTGDGGRVVSAGDAKPPLLAGFKCGLVATAGSRTER